MWTISEDLDEYTKHAEPYLLTDPVANTVPLTVLANLRAGMPRDGAYFGWYTVDGEVRGAVFRTPPFALGLAGMPLEAVPALLEALGGREIDATQGPLPIAEAVAAGRRITHNRAERLYRLGELTVPAGVPGHGRVATAADLDLLTGWVTAFLAEATSDPGHGVRQTVERRTARGDLVLWEDGGAPVAFAGVSLPAGGVSRIGPVYTPPEARGRGYGSAVTAFGSRYALDTRSQHVVLFTDLGNPTSNKIYQAIGYLPVSDYAHITF
ncbi:GNAT family N-acetyltransferase [Nonomuraea soli]|uniref:GNAT superfamily N-acetyltransferase n=1 Tax=Nonomuraea soli TaxID=1032476 RepID=A0A7W0HRY4_9ACTN|nr:GNAT family N-acetyltransferase [Nonomuraea soli]MBA2893440.1 GNAT superfamily N-acetyltransferase [Nonomuraea soli]